MASTVATPHRETRDLLHHPRIDGRIDLYRPAQLVDDALDHILIVLRHVPPL